MVRGHFASPVSGGRWVTQRRWQLARALLTGTALSGLAIVGMSGVATAQAVVATEAVSIAIPAQPLGAAIEAFIAQTGWQVSYASALADGRTSTAVGGTLAPADALDQLLAGTGIAAQVDGTASAVLLATEGGLAEVGLDPNATLLDRVVVAGEKANRDLFSTYTSVGVVTGEDLANQNIADIQGAFETVANAQAIPSASGENNITIRGMNAEGVTQPDRNAPIISMLIDGSFQNLEAMRRGARSLWDVQQVEVLRGPQSTLQGRNSLGGTVIIETNDPAWDYEVKAEGTVGTDDLRSGGFAVSGPILEDQLAFRLSGFISRSDNGITYVNPDDAGLGESELEELRGKLLFEPDAVPGLSALFTISHTHDKPSWNAVDGPDFFDREFDTSGSASEYRDTTVDRYVADISYELTPDWTARSVTALNVTNTTIDAAGLTSTGYYTRDDIREGSDFTQDITLSYEAPDNPFSGVFGLFGGASKMRSDSNIYTDVGLPVVIQDTITETDTTSYAAYADMRYEVASGVTLLGGGRLLHDNVASKRSGEVIDLSSFIEVMPGVYIPGSQSVAEDGAVGNFEFLPKVGVAFEVTDNQTIAFTATKGYRTGFIEAAPGESVARVIEPEYLWAYEAAYRSRWLDDRLEINGNIFYYDYTNQQVVTDSQIYLGQTTTANSAKSRAYGLELEARYDATAELSLFGSLGLIQTEFLDTIIDVNGTPTDISGNEFPNAPQMTAAVGGLYTHESGFFAGARLAYTDGYYSTGAVTNDPARYVDGHATVDTQVGYEMEHAKVTLFVDNLFDAQYLTGIGTGATTASVGAGRTMGIKASAQF